MPAHHALKLSFASLVMIRAPAAPSMCNVAIINVT
jgi:hypothetical protein